MIKIFAKTFIFLLFWLILIVFPIKSIFAIYDPNSVPNNKYGIHLADINDLTAASELVNSTGGDWGYITIVIEDSDMNLSKWQGIFNQMRRLHIIPIVRIATHVSGDSWSTPTAGDIPNWVNFLNLLNWPTSNRYVIIYNEPNHAKEWGGHLNPIEYATFYLEFYQKLKSVNDNFFIMPAGLDVSAANDGESMDAASYLAQMIQAKPEIVTSIDGLASHSYPNPGFSGSPYASGRGTLQSYKWELSYLANLGLSKTLPVFVTETGWTHDEGKDMNNKLLQMNTVSNYISIAAQTVWTDPAIIAITPFVFNYQDYPFDHFSWKKIGTNEYYDIYSVYKSIPKIKGTPLQKQEYFMDKLIIPETLVTDSSYYVSTTIQNKGQSIYDVNDGYSIRTYSNNPDFMTTMQISGALEPDGMSELSAFIKTPKQPGIYHLNAVIGNNVNTLDLIDKDIHVVAPPIVQIQVQLGWKRNNIAGDATVIVYDKDTLIHTFLHNDIQNGTITINGLANIIPGKTYRIVVLVPNYLPRQVIQKLESTKTTIKLKRFIPLDFNQDGNFSFKDILSLWKLTPQTVLSFIF